MKKQRLFLPLWLGLFLAVPIMAQSSTSTAGTGSEIAPGPFQPSWDSLTRFRCPEWFRDAKFGIWAHWGPQSVPMAGDWYARNMYLQNNTRGQYQHHLDKYGHPSTSGWKDVIPLWKAEKFDPERLMKLYKQAGARYFVSMGVHHDNFDLWDSKHHRWNAVQMGPHRNIVEEWRKAARKNGLRFGVSEHLGASFTWFQPSHASDTAGAKTGVPYDGANPQWQELYHPPAAAGDNAWYSTNPQWMQEWFLRIKDLVDQVQPDLLYTDGALPFGEVGRKMLAHFYNANQSRNHGKLDAVYTLKDWRPRTTHGEYVDGIGIQDVERGGLSGIKPQPWQTDTSIGDWFYNQNWKAKDTGKMYRSPASRATTDPSIPNRMAVCAVVPAPPNHRLRSKPVCRPIPRNGITSFECRHHPPPPIPFWSHLPATWSQIHLSNIKGVYPFLSTRWKRYCSAFRGSILIIRGWFL